VTETAAEQCGLSFQKQADDTLSVFFAGSWKSNQGLPPFNKVQQEIESNPHYKHITFDTQELTDWDSGFLTFLIKVFNHCSRQKISVNDEGLPQGAKRLMAIAAEALST